MNGKESQNRFFISDSPTEDEMKVVLKGLEVYDSQHEYGDLDVPYNDINLVLKDDDGNIVGGIITSMKAGVMYLEVLWVDDAYRGLGYGKDLVLEAERIGRAKGYTASQAWTFSFQAPEFYQAIGYKVLAICDVYIDNITEYILMKRLDDNITVSNDSRTKLLIIHEDKSEAARKALDSGLGDYVNEQIAKLLKENPQISIKLVIKNDEGQVIGGIQGYTYLKTLHIQLIWIEERFRSQGYGKQLLMEAERIAKENGSDSVIAFPLSFQSPEFFRKCGYEVFGVSDGYPDPVKEYFFQKRF